MNRANRLRYCLMATTLLLSQQFAYTTGKNATDGAMIIDAMDLLYTGRFSGFCIVSSDSDFARLAARAREQGVMVYGFGERKTPRPFITACDKFVYFDILNTSEIEQHEGSGNLEKGSSSALKTPATKVGQKKVVLDAATLDMLSKLSMQLLTTAGRQISQGLGHISPNRLPTSTLATSDFDD